MTAFRMLLQGVAVAASFHAAAATHQRATGGTVNVQAYNSADCTGNAVFSQDFDNSQSACQSLTLQGNKVYGQVYCQSGQPVFNSCVDSACSTCQSVPLMSSGNCGTGLGVYGSAKAVCPSDGGSSSSSTTTTTTAAIPNSAAAASVSTGLVGVAAAGAALVTLML